MVKITTELIELSPQYTNPLKDREIDLRGCKISVIENLGATLDQFDCIDLSDNDIKKVEGFPLLKRLKMLLLSNNRICRFEEHLEESLPNLENITLTNNNIQELVDLDPLSTIKSLTHASFLRNPVANKPNYRSYLIYKVPQLRVIDFQRVKLKEREAAKKLFSGKKGDILKKEIASKRSKTFEVKDIQPAAAATTVEDEKFLAEKYKDQEAIKDAINKATTLEDVQKLDMLLQQGHIPGKTTLNGDSGVDTTENEVEME